VHKRKNIFLLNILSKGNVKQKCDKTHLETKCSSSNYILDVRNSNVKSSKTKLDVYDINLFTIKYHVKFIF